MLRLFAALTFLFLNLQACKGGYDSCKLKIQDSNALSQKSISVVVAKNRRLVFSHKKPSAKIFKHDPYLSLYLIEDKQHFKYPFKFNNRHASGIASVDKETQREGQITRHQIGLNNFALFNEKLIAPALLLTSCCSLKGFVTPEGIIEQVYLQHFLQTKNVSYSDIGIRVIDDAGFVLVSAINPFLEGNNFHVGDCIVKFDGKKVTHAGQLMQWILFSKMGTSHKVQIKRDNKLLTLTMKSSKRNGGGYLSDTFLEFLGVSFDKNLKIIAIEEKAKKYHLKLGDKLVQINGKKIQTEAQVLQIISKSKESTNLLFDRHNFQFFVKVKSI